MAGTVRAVLSIDVGTTAVKSMVVECSGQVLAVESVDQPMSLPRVGWTEQDPDMWWLSTQKAVSAVIDRIHRLPKSIEVCAVGLTGQMHSSVFLDKYRKVIRPALLWNDMRTTSQCIEITDKLGISGLLRTGGNLALEGFTAPKLLWLRQNEPKNYGRLRTLLLAKDYVRYQLTGEIATELSDAAGTMLLDIRNLCWSVEALQTLSLSSEILPRFVGSTEVSGQLTKDVADILGLPAGLPVVGGGADNAAGAVGSGVVQPGVVQSSIGTSGVILMPTEEPRFDSQMRLHTFCHSVPGQWYMMGVILSAGNALKWMRDILSPDGNYSYQLLIDEAGRIPPGSDGLLFLPYLAGERTPHNDSSARGVFFGLHLGHTRAHMIRSVMEGVCFALRDALQLMRPFIVGAPKIRAIGGGARSSIWCQMQADVFNSPVVTLSESNGPAYGAAAMAAVGAGMYGTIGDVVDQWVSTSTEINPDPARTRNYNELYEQYVQLYRSLKPRFDAS